MRWILDRRERGLSNKILKIYSIRSAGERNFFESRKISAGDWRIIYASQRNLIVEEEEKVSRISKIVIRRYTNFQRKRRIYIIDRTKKEIVIADRYLLWNLDIGFIFEFTRRRRRVTGSKCRPRRETSRQVGQIDLAGILQEFGWFSIQSLIHSRVNRYLYEKPRSRFEIVIHPVTQTYLSRNGSKRTIYLWRNCYTIHTTIGGHLSKNSQTILSLSTFPLLPRLDSIKPEWEKRFHLAKGERGGVKIHPSFRFSS